MDVASGTIRAVVLSMLLVAQPVEVLTETDTPERSALASQVDYGHSNVELSACPMLDPNQAGNAKLDTDPSEHSAPMTNVDFGCAVVSAGKRCPGSPSNGRNILSTSGGVVGPRR